MANAIRLSLLAMLLFVVWSVASPVLYAQTSTPGSDSTAVTASVNGERIRFAALEGMAQLRLEVYSELAQPVFDSELRGGNVLDWTVQDGSGTRLPDGNYICVVTIKTLSGRLKQRIGSLQINGQQINIHAIKQADMSQLEQQRVGPIENESEITVVAPSEVKAATVVAHDGTDGQISRSAGALSFRLGDFFSGKDQEQMRLSEDGNLGIGTENPQSKLEVAGTIRAQRVLITKANQSDGKKDKGVDAGAGDAAQPLASGSGTPDRIAKWTDNSGTLGDSVLKEANGNVGLGVANPGDLLDVSGPPNAAGARSGLHVTTTGSYGNATVYFDNDRTNFNAYGGVLTGGSANTHTLFGMTRADKTFLFADGPFSQGLGVGTLVPQPLVFGTSNFERMRIASGGNVGIGTSAPLSLLDVAGNINTSTQYNIGGTRALSISLSANNTFVGNQSGASITSGTFNSFFGDFAGSQNTTGGGNAFFGNSAGGSNISGGSNAFFGYFAGWQNKTGDFNSFFGNQAGGANASGPSNSFFGSFSGISNTTGANNSFFGANAGATNNASNNSFFGTQAGQSNTTGSANAFFGRQAGMSNTIGASDAFFGHGAGFANTSGTGNAFFGFGSGLANTTGNNNSFFGLISGWKNMSGAGNSFFGNGSGVANSSGSQNSFFGEYSGEFNTSGLRNSFFGASAGGNSTGGNNNIAIGDHAGANLLNGSNNIYLGGSPGADESNTIRLGTLGTQTATFIAGISGSSVIGDPVVVSVNGQLGTGLLSSVRFKRDIRPMGNASSRLMQLRPVTFLYKSELVKGDQTLQYGLIAEEVAKVYPELVQFVDGQPQTVRYHLLSTMLLNELQKQQQKLQFQSQQLQNQEQEIKELADRLHQLEERTKNLRRRSK